MSVYCSLSLPSALQFFGQLEIQPEAALVFKSHYEKAINNSEYLNFLHIYYSHSFVHWAFLQ